MLRSIKRQIGAVVLANGFLRPRLGRWFAIVPQYEAFLKDCDTILHVGANDGLEALFYDSLGLNVIWVEPIPAVFQKLTANIAPFSRQRAVQAIVTDRAGQNVTLNLADNGGASSSIFAMDKHKEIWPEVGFVDKLDLVSTTVDGIVGEGDRIDALVIDTQGAELLVLQGADRVLRGLKYVKAEAADFSAYAGGCTRDDLVDYLIPRGFDIISETEFAKRDGVGRYADVVFKRVR